MSNKFLSEFYVVTKSGSVYAVRFDQDNVKPVILRKIAQGGNTKNPLEESRDERLAITKCLVLLHGQESSQALLPPTADNWTLISSPIAGLFLSEDKAMECVAGVKLKKCDPQWEEHTIGALKAIGLNHPYCLIPIDDPFCLLPPEKWCE